MIGGKADIYLISETKIDGTFPTSQFLLSGYSNVYHWLDRNDKRRGTMLPVKDNLITVLLCRKDRDILRGIKPQEANMHCTKNEVFY